MSFKLPMIWLNLAMTSGAAHASKAIVILVIHHELILTPPAPLIYARPSLTAQSGVAESVFANQHVV